MPDNRATKQDLFLPGLSWSAFATQMSDRLKRVRAVVDNGGLAAPGAAEHMEKNATVPMGAAANYFSGRDHR